VPYVVDQLNHDKFTPNPELLRCERIRSIFLIRDAEETIQSLLKLTKPHSDGWPLERAVDYYVRRTNSLATYAGILGERAIALTYADLVDHTATALRQIESFLGLTSELRPEYSMQPFTGKRGDPSDGIRLGRIERRATQTVFPTAEGEVRRAAEAYRSCLSRFNLCAAPLGNR
jgi:hypothetical protein